MSSCRFAPLIALAACHAPAPLGAATAPTGCEPGDRQVAMFEHARFAGRCVTLDIGDVARIDAAFDETISSISVGRDVRVLVCSDRDFGGACQYFDHSAQARHSTWSE